ncbi:MAG: flavin oxidoreductase/NADH oxidase [Oscillospiraceae bacterium]|jgi:2,4-dienoyl-CoA reductase-like NADH-dependent reductase (Old Yellow Enzyme family)|nr:flavin oxidoreductase/NADH oxidase [Oscillospiraceae bacterium]
MPHERFHYKSLIELRQTAERESAWLPFDDDLSALSLPLTVHNHSLPNRIAIQPMEGSDSAPDGAPGELTFRRYERFAMGGTALIWFEAVAVADEARANPRQLILTEHNLDAYKRLIDSIHETGLRTNGYAPLVVIQSTHSGRYSKPYGSPRPRVAYNNPLFEDTPLPPSAIITDDELRQVETAYGTTAALAERAGFDGVDVKACHRYLINELLSAYNRPGAYGGDLAGRSRFLYNAMESTRASVSNGMILTTRINVYDGFPYPYGFGVKPDADPDEALTPDLSEPLTLIGGLVDRFKLPIIDITIGNPYKNPHVNRPYDAGGYVPDEHPLVGLSRMMQCVSAVQNAFPRLPVIGSAFSYPRQFAPNLAAGMIGGQHCHMAGFGRMALAYPDFANDILRGGGLNAGKVCLTCGQCAGLLRQGKPSGCVIRDPEYRRSNAQ